MSRNTVGTLGAAVIASLVALGVAVLVVQLRYPQLMYQAVTGVLVALAGIIFWQKAEAGSKFLAVSLIWYALFWAIRDTFFLPPGGFRTVGTDMQNFLSIMPVLMAIIYVMNPLAGPWWYVPVLILHGVLVVLMRDTDNELLAVFAVGALVFVNRSNVRIVAIGFLWYQVWLSASKYVAFSDDALLYSWALTPYLASLLLVVWRRLSDGVHR